MGTSARYVAGIMLEISIGYTPSSGDDAYIEMVEEAMHLTLEVSGPSSALVDFFPLRKQYRYDYIRGSGCAVLRDDSKVPPLVATRDGVQTHGHESTPIDIRDGTHSTGAGEEGNGMCLTPSMPNLIASCILDCCHIDRQQETQGPAWRGHSWRKQNCRVL